MKSVPHKDAEPRRFKAFLRVSASLCAAGLWLWSADAAAGPTGEPEPALRQALMQAVAAADSFDHRYDAEVWLADMSDRLGRYAPAALPDARQRLEFLRILHAEATRAGVPAELALAVIEVESRFDRHAVSRSGAQGYMQIMPFWLARIGKVGDNLFHARTNLRMGCTILKYYLDRERGDTVKALQRYNGSYGKADYPHKVLDALTRRWFRN
ncbi:MAG: lytic transglycosylase domain-containing protein [Gammaproteobacteria bacterium]|nr:lytic transglycosylase domain-containing protein [Gammaproteobacteria bacterium]